ncbi:MAG TPA: hypothetical protein VJO52_13115 [Gemmatimonadaceae bacterium]|nr:hypothetical protein [Gemmatimonadaceae bacterium]
MSVLTIVLRLVHIVGGVLWVGFAVFGAAFLLPAIAETGPEGGKVMMALQRRHLLTVIPILALLTVISGIWLYGRAASMAPGFGGSRMGITLGVGGVCALVALFVGMLVITPAMNGAVATAQQAAQAATNEERQALMILSAQRRARGARGSKVATVLLIVAACAMAVGRYV